MTMNQNLLQVLICPVCKASMTQTEDGKICRCTGTKTHCFDFAKSGHIHLGGPHAGDGDTKEAILARRFFLDAGYYKPLSYAVNELLTQVGANTVLDAGCGEGYYTNNMAQGRDVIGIDLSRAGVEYAAKRAKQLQNGAAFAVASIFSMPIQSGSIDAVTNLFAPCAEDEFSRVLKENGYLVFVGAGKNHLMGLKEVLYDNPYENPGRADLPTKMRLVDQQRLQYEISLSTQPEIQALFAMTPYYWRTSPKDRAKLESLHELTTDVDFDIFLFRKDLSQ